MLVEMMKPFRRWLFSTPFPAILIATFTSLFLLGSKSFWVDETFSYYIAHSSWNTFSTFIWNQEINMWLYYFLLHFWLLFGQSDIFIRSLSAIFAILSIPVFYKLGEYLFNRRIASIASVLLSLHIFFVYYAQEARSYSLLLFLTCVSVYSFLRFEENKKFKILYIVSSSLSVYAHVYGALILFSQALYALDKRKAQIYGIGMVIIGISLIPLLFAPALHSHVADWLTRPSIQNIGGTFFLLGDDFFPLDIVYGLIFMYAIFHSIIKRKNLHLFILVFIPIAVAFIISAEKPIYQPVYFIICLPAFLLIISDAIGSIIDTKRRRVIFITLVLLSVARLYSWYVGVQEHVIDTVKIETIDNYNEDWRDATKYITNQGDKDDVAIFYVYFGKLDYDFYSTEMSPKSVEIASGPYSAGGGTLLPQPNKELIASFTNKRLWFVVNRDTDHYLNREQQYGEVESLLGSNYRRIHEIYFAKVRVEEFQHN